MGDAVLVQRRLSNAFLMHVSKRHYIGIWRFKTLADLKSPTSYLADIIVTSVVLHFSQIFTLWMSISFRASTLVCVSSIIVYQTKLSEHTIKQKILPCGSHDFRVLGGAKLIKVYHTQFLGNNCINGAAKNRDFSRRIPRCQSSFQSEASLDFWHYTSCAGSTIRSLPP